MKRTFDTYPELLLIDATYKLNDLQMPLYVVMVVDGNGESEIVSLWITQFEDKETITELVQEFKKHNEKWSAVQCIIMKCLSILTMERDHRALEVTIKCAWERGRKVLISEERGKCL